MEVKSERVITKKPWVLPYFQEKSSEQSDMSFQRLLDCRLHHSIVEMISAAMIFGNAAH
jgi:hypothetical protein